MLAEVEHLRRQQLAGLAREQRLTPVRGRRDPRAEVHVPADVALVDEVRRARVKTCANADRARLEFRERLGHGPHRALGRRECDEERVSLRVDLHPAAGAACRPQDAAVLGQRLPVPGWPERLQQARRLFDVREQEGDRARRQFGTHAGQDRGAAPRRQNA